MSDAPNLEWLQEKVRQMKALLDDPHPGLISWSVMYGKLARELRDFWTDEDE